MVSESEKDRDNWVRLTLRLPPELHSQILSRAGVMSLNGAIVHFLQVALKLDEAKANAETLLGEAGKMHEEIDKKLEDYKNRRERGDAIVKDMIEQLSAHIGKVVKSSVREEVAAILENKEQKGGKKGSTG